ncbi:MAG TPA: dihydroneopterin aldolase, partial [Verrucomicrobiae bacterium]
MDTIIIADLEIWCHVGVPDEERAKPQRLLVTIEMEHDFKVAAATDHLDETIDYFAVAQGIQSFGQTRHWKLIEALASDIAATILEEYRARKVTVEVKKF